MRWICRQKDVIPIENKGIYSQPIHFRLKNPDVIPIENKGIYNGDGGGASSDSDVIPIENKGIYNFQGLCPFWTPDVIPIENKGIYNLLRSTLPNFYDDSFKIPHNSQFGYLHKILYINMLRCLIVSKNWEK